MLDPARSSPSPDHPLIKPNKTRVNFEGNTTMSRYGARARRTARNYESCRDRSGGDGVRFRAHVVEEDESGVCSPPLWKTGSATPPRVVAGNSYRNLSPNSRSQAIARGQWELMEMVKDMPETCYELSLKDLVEHPCRVESSQEQCLLQEKGYSLDHGGGEALHQRARIGRQGSCRKRATATGGSIDKRGLFLKMVFPVPVGMSRRKSSLKNSGPLAPSNASARVSSTPETVAERSSKGVADGEWWKKRSGSTESESGRSSSRTTGRSSSSGSSESSGSCHNSSNSRRYFSLSPLCLSLTL